MPAPRAFSAWARLDLPHGCACRCLGCVRGTDPWDQQPPALVEWQDFELEPFSQTRMVSGLRKADETYNTSLVLPGNGCLQEHFGLVVEAHANFSGEMVFGLVTGKLEVFSGEELMLYPSFVIGLHGAVWTDLGFTWIVLAVAIALIDVLGGAVSYFNGSERYVPSIVGNADDPRSWLLQVALWAFWTAASDQVLHIILSSIDTKASASLFIALMLTLLSQLLPAALVIAIWRARLRNTGCTASPWWAPVQLFAAISFFFLFGAHHALPTHMPHVPHVRTFPVRRQDRDGTSAPACWRPTRLRGRWKRSTRRA